MDKISAIGYCLLTIRVAMWLSDIDNWLFAPARTTNQERGKRMAKYQKFEDLPVWQEAARLYNRVLDLLEEPNVPLSPGYRNQLDRAALSVSNNIAEGFERVTTNELNAFLAIARVMLHERGVKRI
jgi:hypothetical protein